MAAFRLTKLLSNFAWTIFLLSLAYQAASAQIYSKTELSKDEARLRSAIQRIYFRGIKPVLTPQEIAALGDFQFRFPYPDGHDDFMNFAAATDGSAVFMPLESLKGLEDLTTAFAWLYHNKYSLSTIDIYFAMLRFRDPKDFPDGKLPQILEALGVPKDAYKTSKQVDELSLSLRNEAYAFIISHELGHILHRHKPINEITAVQAQKDEIQSDNFAFEIFKRTNTPVLGPVIFFQAQAYRLLERHKFTSEKEWLEHVKQKMTHPLTADRLASMIKFIEGPFLQQRENERANWLFIAQTLKKLTEILKGETGLGRCIIQIAKNADLSILKPRYHINENEIIRRCNNISHQ